MTTQTLKNWHGVKLDDVLEFYNGKSIKKSQYGEIYPVYGANGIIGFADNFLYEDSIIIGRVGAYCGSVQYERNKFWPSDNTIVVKAKAGKSENAFLYFALKNKNLNNYAGGAAQPLVTQRDLKQLEIDLPDIPTQKQIADVLSTYDDLIENNTRRIQILEQTAQAIYSEWFGSPASSWKTVSLRDVIEFYIGGGWGKEEPDKKYSDTAYVIRGTDIPNASTGNISTCPLRYHTPSNLSTRVLQDGDLVFEVSGGSKGQPVGRSLLATSKFLNQFGQSVICASFCKLIRPNQDKISPFQLYEQILSWYTNGVIEKYQVQSTGISNFRFESFINEEKVTLPPDEIREKFDHLMTPLFDEIYSLGNQNQSLRQTRDLLIPKLVTGGINI